MLGSNSYLCMATCAEQIVVQVHGNNGNLTADDGRIHRLKWIICMH